MPRRPHEAQGGGVFAPHHPMDGIDDRTGRTLASASTLNLTEKGLSKTDQASKVGQMLAERAKAAGIERVVFDRGSYLYHGRVKALADGARAGGLDF